MTKLLVSIDPGYKDCGVAIFRGGELDHCHHVVCKTTGMVEAIQFTETARCVVDYVMNAIDCSTFDLIIEYPQQYARSPAPRESVQRLVGVVGSLVSQFQSKTGGLGLRVTTYKPREWKGQVPKDVMFRRITSKLSGDEIDRIPPLSKTRLSHVYDAVGIGLYHLGRLGAGTSEKTMSSSLG